MRRPGAAALDLCYVAAGFYDGFFETGLNPWDVAAGALMIAEAGGLIGNFTGEADYLYQREVVAGNPKIYGQLVKLLAPFTRVIKDEPAQAAGSTLTPEAALSATLSVSPAPAGIPGAPVRKATRVRKASPPGGGDAPI
jgi:myo-inositol-1(or 4)-monophosphatase